MTYENNMPRICEKRLQELVLRLQPRTTDAIWSGARNPAKISIMLIGHTLSGIPLNNQNRDELLTSIPDLSEEAAFVAIMAWGGQKKSHTVSSWEERDKWLPILAELREGQISPVTAYSRFLRANIRGLGPAFYTKLIFFLQHDKHNRAFIMDQWTAKSMELLLDRENHYPQPKWSSVSRSTRWKIPFYEASLSKNNPTEVYDHYCRFVHELSAQLAEIYSTQLSLNETEEAIFAGARRGKPPMPWREYTMKTWHRQA